MTPQQIRAAFEVLKILHENREKVGELLEFIDEGMPNVKTKTMGGKFFGKVVVEHEGWRLQQNKVMKNCRILDPANFRVAWGGESAMMRAFEKLTRTAK